VDTVEDSTPIVFMTRCVHNGDGDGQQEVNWGLPDLEYFGFERILRPLHDIDRTNMKKEI
jgi:hypothetical protein